MIIDAHNHVMTWGNIPDAYWNAMANYIATIYKELVNRDVTIDAVKQNNLEPLMDTDGSKLLQNMDRFLPVRQVDIDASADSPGI